MSEDHEATRLEFARRVRKEFPGVNMRRRGDAYVFPEAHVVVTNVQMLLYVHDDLIADLRAKLIPAERMS